MLILFAAILAIIGLTIFVRSLSSGKLDLKPLEEFKGNSSVCYFHCHTTGLNPGKDRIIQFCVVRYQFDRKDNVYRREEFSSFVSVDVQNEAEAFSMNNIGADALNSAPEFSQIAGDIRKFIGRRTVVVFMASFHRAFLNQEMNRLGYPSFSVRDLSDIITDKHDVDAFMKFDVLIKKCGVFNRGSDSISRANNVADISEKLGLYKNPKRKDNVA